MTRHQGSGSFGRDQVVLTVSHPEKGIMAWTRIWVECMQITSVGLNKKLPYILYICIVKL